MSVLIRNAEHRDIDQITPIYAHAVRHGVSSFELEPPSREEMQHRFQKLTDAGYPYLVTIDETTQVILGYAYAGPYRSRPAYRYVVEDSVYIAQYARGRGIGKALLADLIKKSELIGFRQMIAVITSGQHNASVALHKRLGFETIGCFQSVGWKHGQWLDTVLMQRPLGCGSSTAPDNLK